MQENVAKLQREVSALSGYQDMLLVEFKKVNLKAINDALAALFKGEEIKSETTEDDEAFQQRIK